MPEYARDYLQQLHREYTQDDLRKIAGGQLQQEDELSRSAGSPLFCDTDLYVVKVWSEHRFGACDPWILEQIAVRKYDLYLLTDIDIVWQDGPMREHGEATMRQYFHDIYQDIVVQSGVPWISVSGAHEQRLQRAIKAIKQLS